MLIKLIAVAGLLSFAPVVQVSAQANPTRFELVNAVLDQRLELFNTPALIDSCSIARISDSVTAPGGSLHSKFSVAARAVPGDCSSSRVAAGDLRVISFERIEKGDGGLLGSLFVTYGPRDGLFTITTRVRNLRSQSYHGEFWVMHRTPSGRWSVVAMVLAGIGGA
jgi:hypothetical protein